MFNRDLKEEQVEDIKVVRKYVITQQKIPAKTRKADGVKLEALYGSYTKNMN